MIGGAALIGTVVLLGGVRAAGFLDSVRGFMVANNTAIVVEERFNFLHSDRSLPPGEEGPIVGTFIGLLLGEQLVDHHFMLVLQSDWVGVHQGSFEVADLDALMSSHDDLLHDAGLDDADLSRTDLPAGAAVRDQHPR